LDIPIPNHLVDQISDRCLRCYKEQQWYGENFLYDFIGDTDVAGQRILEIGCAEAGLLKFYQEKGAICSGLELSDVRFNNAILLNQANSLHLFQANICDPETYASELTEPYNTIVMRDVIEHIDNKKTALKNIFGLLKPNGKLFISFPPKHCAYAGHQQTAPRILGKIPYLHLFPDFIYKAYLKVIGCPEKKIDYLISTKKTRISINQMRKIVKSIGFIIRKESNWFIRPAYSFRFGLPRVKNPFAWFPFLNEIFCNGVLFLLERPEA